MIQLIPFERGFPMRPQASGGPNRAKGFTIIDILVVIAIVGILFGLTLAAVHQSRAAAERSACSHKLRQIGLALQSHQVATGFFPPQHPAPNNSAGSSYAYQGITWHVYLLPFMEQAEIWNRVDEAYRADRSPWTPPHEALKRQVVAGYVCPSDRRLMQPLADAHGNVGAFTSYVGMTGYTNEPRSGLFGRDSGASPADITDGLSHTIAVGERPPPESLSMGWWYTTHIFPNLMSATDGEVPADTGLSPGDPGCGPNIVSWPGSKDMPAFGFARGSIKYECDKYHYWSLHGGGANFLFVDGSVRYLPYAAQHHLRDMATIAGGEIIIDLQFVKFRLAILPKSPIRRRTGDFHRNLTT